MAKLLLVEDDNNLREIYEARLQAEGYEIVSAKDGEEALAVAKAEKPDLVISDIMMPKISGFEMLDILRNTNDLKNIKVIMLTALGQNDDQQRADKLGADRYLVKSQVTLEDIVRAAHELLEDSPAKEASNPEPEKTNEPAAPAAAAAPVSVEPPAAVDEPVASNPAPMQEPAAPIEVEPPVAAAPTPDPVKAEPAVEQAAPNPVAPLIEPVAPEEPTNVNPVTPDTPVQPEIIAEPAAQNEPPAAAAPIDETDVPSGAPAPSANNTTAESASQEKAEVESKIEDFVSGASTDATNPAPVDATAPTDDSTATDDTQDTTTADNEEVVEEKPENTNQDENIVITPTAPALEESEVEGGSTELDSIPDPSKGTNDKVTIAHKKVIAPPQQEEKPSIDELLAKEQAQEATNSATAPNAKAVVVESNPKKNTAPSNDGGLITSNDPQDPSNIAL